MVVVVIGTTKEGAIDPLQDIVNLRERYRGKVGTSCSFVCPFSFLWLSSCKKGNCVYKRAVVFA